jgi:hypothetical protein
LFLLKTPRWFHMVRSNFFLRFRLPFCDHFFLFFINTLFPVTQEKSCVLQIYLSQPSGCHGQIMWWLSYFPLIQVYQIGWSGHQMFRTAKLAQSFHSIFKIHYEVYWLNIRHNHRKYGTVLKFCCAEKALKCTYKFMNTC